ncbi:hypothetical protein ACO22_03009 [Paracoccidioides brasiliensis]|uniref:Uncharacterized protein n=1 Tax=Paracoccidioides brasiliensis TaxID=121759 RepID=A0A1D2JHH3_PARBR|nr:hypothetical protein ACO22_03009 [Paracoccidioides brasiliensis]
MTSLDPTSILSTLQTWSTNLKSNLSNSVTSLTLRDYIRLIWIIEEKAQEQAEAAAVGSVGARAKLSANALRGALGDNSESNDEEDGKGETTGVPQWGKSARRRQRRVLRQLEEAALRHKEEEDDKDIADLLED